jgi:hypothetical protein
MYDQGVQKLFEFDLRCLGIAREAVAHSMNGQSMSKLKRARQLRESNDDIDYHISKVAKAKRKLPMLLAYKKYHDDNADKIPQPLRRWAQTRDALERQKLFNHIEQREQAAAALLGEPPAPAGLAEAAALFDPPPAYQQAFGNGNGLQEPVGNRLSFFLRRLTRGQAPANEQGPELQAQAQANGNGQEQANGNGDGPQGAQGQAIGNGDGPQGAQQANGNGDGPQGAQQANGNRAGPGPGLPLQAHGQLGQAQLADANEYWEWDEPDIPDLS